MTKKERYQFIINYFALNSPDAKTELIFDNPYQLIVAVILSAQCTDKRVNMTTPAILYIPAPIINPDRITYFSGNSIQSTGSIPENAAIANNQPIH